ncbi:MAG: hypothetical protein AB1563_06155 [Bacillota bacterium]|jgi:hypothetical protein
MRMLSYPLPLFPLPKEHHYQLTSILSQQIPERLGDIFVNPSAFFHSHNSFSGEE